MMTLMYLNFVLIILAIGYGVGYWLLVTADRQDRKWMNILGTIFGWILISLSILISLLGLYFHVNHKEEMTAGGCPMHQMMQKHHDKFQNAPNAGMSEMSDDVKSGEKDTDEMPEADEPIKLNDKD